MAVILKESIKIRAQPAAIFRFFEEMEPNYLRWHPNHVLFRWVKGQGLKEDHEAHFEKRIAGELKKMKIVYTRVMPGQYLEFAPARWLFRFLLPRRRCKACKCQRPRNGLAIALPPWTCVRKSFGGLVTG